MEIDECATNETTNPNSISTLEQCGSWLLSIPRDNIRFLQCTPEYKNFLTAFEKLENAHRYTINLQHNDNLKICINDHSFLQHLVVDDVILRIFEFLECHTLIQLTTTCHRFCTLSLRSAEQRTQKFFEPTNKSFPSRCSRCDSNSISSGKGASSPCFCHYRTTIMQLARAKEQILGIRPKKPPFVSIPMWGLPRRIIVSRCGDEEYNGVYFCTGTNGNGFVFTRPRRYSITDNTNTPFLRCIISKRFSNDNILWYMSKEMNMHEDDNTHNRFDLDLISRNNQEKRQIFSFWAELMRSGEASSDVCRYPSQTSILSRGGGEVQHGWQSLENTSDIHPPVVELLD